MTHYRIAERKIKHFRVGKMINTDMVPENRLVKSGFSKIKMAQYTNRLFGMFEGDFT